MWLPISNDKMFGPVTNFFGYIQKVGRLPSPNMPAEMFQIRDKNDELLTLQNVCD